MLKKRTSIFAAKGSGPFKLIDFVPNGAVKAFDLQKIL